MKYNKKKYPILTKIDTPAELRKLPQETLITLSHELRQFLLDTISQSSGHFASGLGAIELTIALHYVYDTPFDSLIWDVGHQAYPHKILTGRRDTIFSIRKKDGLHPFPYRDESQYDVLSVGHSSTSISAGLGMAVAAKKEMLGRRTICVIGDGAITAGIAFEAMNHAGRGGYDILVILNDNKMSISKNVGALNKHLKQIVSKKCSSNSFENNKKIFFHHLPIIQSFLKHTEKYIKKIIRPNSLFEKMGFNYIGPINGHNISKLITTLKKIKNFKGPLLLHIKTKKGYGYAPAEKDPITWHFIPKFNAITKKLPKKKNKTTYSKIFGDWLCYVASKDKKLIAITPAMSEGSGMKKFSQQYPKQYFDVAIAEQHAVTFAAGLAISGYKPVVAIYSTFLQRAYDQVIHDIAIQKLPVLLAIDRGGVVGSDGQTHQGAFDLSYLRCIPNILIMTPSSENECKLMLHTGYNYKYGPSAVRYPKGEINHLEIHNIHYNQLYNLPLGKGVICRKGENIAILNFGTLLEEAKQAACNLNATLVDMRFVKPLDEDLLNKLTKNHQALITLEENSVLGGAGSGVNEFLMREKILIPVLNLGLPDFFIPQGSQKEIRSDLKLDGVGIFEQITKWISN